MTDAETGDDMALDDRPEDIPARLEEASNTPIVTRSRRLCDGMTQPQIVAALVAEARDEGYEPCDLNHAGAPNLYLREHYAQDVLPGGGLGPPIHLDDLFVINVRQTVMR